MGMGAVNNGKLHDVAVFRYLFLFPSTRGRLWYASDAALVSHAYVGFAGPLHLALPCFLLAESTCTHQQV